MEENKKYYTPDISEFHVGFEYEFRDFKNPEKFNKEVVTLDNLEFLDVIEGWIKLKDIKVKYLDKEDIEELGWKIVEVIDDFTITASKDEFRLFYFLNLKNLKVLGNTSIKFEGFIKNKSELKKLMQQLNIK